MFDAQHILYITRSDVGLTRCSEVFVNSPFFISAEDAGALESRHVLPCFICFLWTSAIFRHLFLEELKQLMFFLFFFIFLRIGIVMNTKRPPFLLERRMRYFLTVQLEREDSDVFTHISCVVFAGPFDSWCCKFVHCLGFLSDPGDP